MFHGCFEGLSSKYQKGVNEVPRVLLGSFNSVYRVFHNHWKVFQISFLKFNMSRNDFDGFPTSMSDEIKSADDIVSIWHIDPKVAKEMFNLFIDVVFEEPCDILLDDEEIVTTDESSEHEVDTSLDDE